MSDAVSFNLDLMTRSLAEDEPFGSASRPLKRAYAFYQFAIDIFAERSRQIQQLSSALAHTTEKCKELVLSHPVLRATINETFARMMGKTLHDLHLLENITPPLLTLLENTEYQDDRPAFPEMRSLECTDLPHTIWIWNTSVPQHRLTQRFEEIFQREFTLSGLTSPVLLKPPDDTLMRTISQSCELLMRLFPELTRSLFEHVRILAIVDLDQRQLQEKDINHRETALFESASYDAIPGTIFLAPSSLRTPWHAAEAIFHEAAHQKLNDIRLTYSIFRPGYAAETSSRIQAIWNKSLDWNSNQWPIDRAIGAFHVYVHLYPFFQIIADKASAPASVESIPTDFAPLERAYQAYERATYLGQQLKQQAGNDLQIDGYRLVDWLLSLLTNNTLLDTQQLQQHIPSHEQRIEARR